MTILYPIVSIIIPVFNVEDYLVDCLESVLNQDFENYEVIAVDDGSQDSSPEILQQYACKYQNLKISLQPQNKGQGYARNVGLDISKGKYILFVDSDDYIERNTLTTLVNELEGNSVELVRFKSRKFTDSETYSERVKNPKVFLKEHKVYEGKLYKEMYLSYLPSPVIYLFKKSILIENNIRFVEKIIHEDEAFSTLLYLYSQSAVYVDKFLYNRRYRDGSTMTTKTPEHIQRSVRSYVEILKTYKERLSDRNLKSIDRFFLKYRINSIYLSLQKRNLDEDLNHKLQGIKENKIYYTNIYQYYIRFLKMISLLKVKIS